MLVFRFAQSQLDALLDIGYGSAFSLTDKVHGRPVNSATKAGTEALFTFVTSPFLLITIFTRLGTENTNYCSFKCDFDLDTWSLLLDSPLKDVPDIFNKRQIRAAGRPVSMKPSCCGSCIRRPSIDLQK